MPKRTSPEFSVIITTAPGREANLRACLEMLLRQTLPPREVIVCDDGSEGGGELIHKLKFPFPVQILWRPGDRCVSRSRNQGARQARFPFLLFLDGDVLLNPEGLQAYAEHFERQPLQALAGMAGNRLEHEADSVLIPGRRVNYLDRRIQRFHRQGLYFSPAALRYPYGWAWSSNLAVPKVIYEATGGFDEGYVGWGGEDDQFVLDLIRRGYELHFTLDTWAEHQVHPRKSAFYQKPPQSKRFFANLWGDVGYRCQALGAPERVQAWMQLIFNRYLYTDSIYSEAFVLQMRYPDAIWFNA